MQPSPNPTIPRPHHEVLTRLFDNPQLPESDRARREEVFNRYMSWINELNQLSSSASTFIPNAVSLLNNYKNFIDLDFTADGSTDSEGKVWLMRQKGQTKHSATIMEEFIPYMVSRLFTIPDGYSLGPAKSILSLIIQQIPDGFHLDLNVKDIDFAIYRTISVLDTDYNVAAFALELKDHVDKTMISGTMWESNLYHQTFPCGFYGLVAGWRDLGPQAYQPLVGLDYFWLTRKAKRMGHPRDNPIQVRNHWESNPYLADVFEHLFAQVGEFLERIPEFENDFHRLSLDLSNLDPSQRVRISHTILDSQGWIN